MWCFERPLPQERADSSRFLASLKEHADFFVTQQPLWTARAPGRLDLMGGIADYSGSLVLELPLAAATWVAVQVTKEPELTFLSTDQETQVSDSIVRVDLTQFQALKSYEEAQHYLNSDAGHAWIAYVAGTLFTFLYELKRELKHGLRFFIYSEVPLGKGVSSSAALEVATMQALCGLYNQPLAGRELALLCQRAENLIVGAPCGIMDQISSACGEQDSLLALLCQPAELQGTVALPENVEVWGVDSGIRHAVTGADYGSVRVGAFMGYRIIADLAGLEAQVTDRKHVHINDPCWSGYLANISPSLWETAYRDLVPEQIEGSAFLARYGGLTDTVTRVEPDRLYSVRQSTAHPIYEHHRVRLFRSLLTPSDQSRVTDEQLTLAGQLMYQSHASYSACGLGSDGTDRLVELVRTFGAENGLYGAKITGGGSGGTVAILAHKGSRQQIQKIVAQYESETGRNVTLIAGSSPGAVAWGSHKMIIEP